MDLIGRLQAGRTLAEAQAEMTVLVRRLEQAEPDTHRGAGLVVSKLRGTLRIPVIHGRGIEQRDIDQGRPLVVVNEGLARRLWPEQDPTCSFRCD